MIIKGTSKYNDLLLLYVKQTLIASIYEIKIIHLFYFQNKKILPIKVYYLMLVQRILYKREIH